MVFASCIPPALKMTAIFSLRFGFYEFQERLYHFLSVGTYVKLKVGDSPFKHLPPDRAHHDMHELLGCN